MGAAVADHVHPPVVLRDGSAVRLRPMAAEDAPGLVRFHEALSSETVYLRFFSVHPHLSGPEVHRFTHVDHRDREAIVAIAGDEIVAVARFDRLPDRDEAEVAFVVADRWQGLGLGSALLARLADMARAAGVTRFSAETLPHNRRMLAVFRRSGLPMRTTLEDGVVHAVLDL
jgi:GNAT superfamily N-acetyltransferase